MTGKTKLISIFPGLGKPQPPVSIPDYLRLTGLVKPEDWDKFAFECCIPRYTFRKIMGGEITNISDELLLQMSFHSGMDFQTLKNINDAWKSNKQSKRRK